MMKLITVLNGTQQSNARNDDDKADRLSHRFTVSLFLMFSILVTMSQYVGDRIHCWCPAHFADSWQEYAEQYCWVRNTYYLPFEEEIPIAFDPKQREMIPYYQWVPVILMLQAFFFFVPCMMWRTLNDRSGIDVNNLVDGGISFQQSIGNETRRKTLGLMVQQFDRFLTHGAVPRPKSIDCSIAHAISRTLCFRCGRQYGNYLTVLYTIVKLLYLLNVVGQMFLLNAFLGFDFHMYGVWVLTTMATDGDWTQSSRFPRVTMCDFFIRGLGQLRRYTLQCALPINLFAEKIFLFIWWWLAFVALITFVSLCTWVMRFVSRWDQMAYIKKHLQYSRGVLNEKGRLNKFLHHYLKADGIFVLRLIGHNTDSITSNEVISGLWDFTRPDTPETVLMEKDDRSGIETAI